MSKFNFKEHKSAIIASAIAIVVMIGLIVGMALMWKPNKPADEEVNTGFSAESEDKTSATVSDIEVPDIPEDKTESKEADITVEGNPNGGEEPEPLPPTTSEDVNEPQWTEAAYDKTMYVTENCNARKIPILGADIVKAYKKGTQVHVIAKTSTSYYKLEDETFIHQNYLSLVKPVEEQPKPPVITPDEPVDIASLPDARNTTWETPPAHGALGKSQNADGSWKVVYYHYYLGAWQQKVAWDLAKDYYHFTPEQAANLNDGDTIAMQADTGGIVEMVWCECGIYGSHGHVCLPSDPHLDS